LDFTTEAHAFQLRCDLDVEHNVCCALALGGPLFVRVDLLRKGLNNVEHLTRHLVAIDINLALRQQSLDLIVCQLVQRILELLVVLLFEGLTQSSVVRLDPVHHKVVFILLKFELKAIQLVLNVVLETLVTCKHFVVRVDKSDAG